MRFDSILVAVGLEVSSARLVARACELVAPGGKLTVLHVVPRTLARWTRRLSGRREEQARATLAGILGAIPPVEGHVELEVRAGHPATELLRLADQAGVGLIVLERSRGALEVVKAARVPTLVIARGADPLRRVLLALEFSTASAKAASAGLELAARLGVSAEALHVIDPTAPGAEDRVLAHACEGIASLIQLAANQAVPVRVRLGSPCRALVAAAEPVDVVVCGSRRAGLLERLTAPSVTAALLRNGRGSVLVVPPPSGVELPFASPDVARGDPRCGPARALSYAVP
jgi:nucleotide-binding universal stress UspA family protein